MGLWFEGGDTGQVWSRSSKEQAEACVSADRHCGQKRMRQALMKRIATRVAVNSGT